MQLMLLLLVPFLMAVFVFLCSLKEKKLKLTSFVLSLFPFLWLIVYWQEALHFSVKMPWIPSLGLEFYLAIDSLSLVFLLLTAIVIPLSLLSCSSEHKETESPLFYGLVLLLEGLLIGFFLARDLLLFTLFFEAMLFPLFLVISLWGGGKREEAAFQFILYMIAGSCLMIVALVALYFASATALGSGTFDMDKLAHIGSNLPQATLLFVIFLLAFAVKTPLFPFHGWLPAAYTEAPFAGSILLAAILSKGGIYGLMRVGLEIFPKQLQEASPILLALAIVGVLWGGLSAWAQSDFKRLIAYSSFSHVNFVLAGLFMFNQEAISGSILQAFNHGVTITGMFLAGGWLAERIGRTTIGPESGLAKYMPMLTWLTLFFALSSIALPGTNNFVGELIILYGLFLKSHGAAFILGLSVILSAMYMLGWIQKSFFSTPSLFKNGWMDIGKKELVLAAPLIFVILLVGIYPSPMLKLTDEASKIVSSSRTMEKR